MDWAEIARWGGWTLSLVAAVIAIEGWLRRNELRRARDKAETQRQEAEEARQAAEAARAEADLAREAAQRAERGAAITQARRWATLWDMTRTDAPRTPDIAEICRKVGDPDIIGEIRRMETALYKHTRLITQEFGQTLGDDLTYDLIKSMIAEDQVRTTWALRLLLGQVQPVGRRDEDSARECFELLVNDRQTKTDQTLQLRAARALLMSDGAAQPHVETAANLPAEGDGVAGEQIDDPDPLAEDDV